MPNEGERPAQDPPPKPRWPWFAAGAVVLLFVAFVLYNIWAPHALQKTDDAYVTAHFATVAPRVAGQVAELAVTDNQRVSTGQLLLLIDDRDFRNSLAEAQAALQAARAQAAQTRAQLARQPAVIRKAQAQVNSETARIALSRTNALRYANLAGSGAGTGQQAQQSAVELKQTEASIDSARADLSAAVEERDALQADLDSALARVGAQEAQAAQAELNLSYTRLVAPIDGVVDQRSVQVGNFLSPGAPVMVVVPLDGIYVVANYRELALRHMRPGQPVRIHVDTYAFDLAGAIDSLPPSSGTAYAPIPPNNATGNFTKIVQRFPLKIVFAPGQRLLPLVRVGMSVETTVDTRLDDVVAAQGQSPARVTERP